jgi:hypothetical protein
VGPYTFLGLKWDAQIESGNNYAELCSF